MKKFISTLGKAFLKRRTCCELEKVRDRLPRGRELLRPRAGLEHAAALTGALRARAVTDSTRARTPQRTGGAETGVRKKCSSEEHKGKK